MKDYELSARTQNEQQNSQLNQLKQESQALIGQMKIEITARNHQLERLSAELQNAKGEIDYRNKQI